MRVNYNGAVSFQLNLPPDKDPIFWIRMIVRKLARNGPPNQYDEFFGYEPAH